MAEVAPPTLLLMTVDTEEAWDWDGPFPTTDYCVDHVQRLVDFQAVCERHGIRPTYFANYAVMSQPASRDTMLALAARDGVEVGMHVHPWNTPPFVPGEAVVPRDTYLATASAATIRTKLGAVLGAMHAAGLNPRSFRGGRYSTGGEIHAFLKHAGFVADCSIVPYTSWMEEGSPDFSRDGVMPRRLEPSAKGGHGLWEIPQSAGFTREPFDLLARMYRNIERGPLSRLRLIGIAERLGLVRKIWLNLELDDTADWVPFLLRLRAMRVPVVTITVHSSSLFAGPGPYTRDIADERRMFERIERVFAAIGALEGFRPATACEAAASLESNRGSRRER